MKRMFRVVPAGAITALCWVMSGFALFLVVFHSCSMMTARAAAKNPLYRVPAWIQDCAKHRPLPDCMHDWQAFELARERSAR